MKYLKTYNESVKNLMTPKEIDYANISPEKILEYSIKNDEVPGFKYLIDNNLVDETTKYLIEKYKFNLHKNELKDYEEWFLGQLTDLEMYKSKYNEDILIYKKDNNVLFNYDLKNYIFYYSYAEIYSVFYSKFKLSGLQMNLLIMGMIEEHLKIRVDTTPNRQKVFYSLIKEHLK